MLKALITKYLGAAGVTIIVAAAVIGALWLYRWDAQRTALKDAYISQLETQVKALAIRKARIDTVLVRDTLRLTHWQTRYDTARINQVVMIHDTAYIPRTVADSTVNACTLALHDCLAVRALNDTLTDSLRTLTHLQHPSTLHRLLDHCGVGPAWDALSGKLTVDVGCHLWP